MYNFEKCRDTAIEKYTRYRFKSILVNAIYSISLWATLLYCFKGLILLLFFEDKFDFFDSLRAKIIGLFILRYIIIPLQIGKARYFVAVAKGEEKPKVTFLFWPFLSIKTYKDVIVATKEMILMHPILTKGITTEVYYLMRYIVCENPKISKEEKWDYAEGVATAGGTVSAFASLYAFRNNLLLVLLTPLFGLGIILYLFMAGPEHEATRAEAYIYAKKTINSENTHLTNLIKSDIY